ncbi:MAG: adenosine deaminase [Butyrivibrio sp.]
MIDLHLHLDGSLRPSTVWELLRQQGKEFSLEETERLLSVSEECGDLNDYLKTFEYPVKVLQSGENIERAVRELGEDIFAEGVTYGEIRFAPILSANNDLSVEEAAVAAIRGAKAAEENNPGLRLGIILCCMRGSSHSDNMLTVEAAHRNLGSHLCALDLAGAEGIFATELYEQEFLLARRYGIPFTIHAGEAAGPESIWKALEFGASRIGHGIRCIEDDVLVDYLARYEIPLEVCPVSNMQTKVFGDMEEYPLKELLIRGVHATLNTDNRTVSSTNLVREQNLVKKYCRITDRDLNLMEEYSVKAAFLTP